DAPTLICVFYDCTLEDRNPCNTPFIGAGMAIQSVLLAAEAEGIGSIYLGGIRNPTGVAKALNAPAYLKNVGIICVGYKDDAPPSPDHRSPADIISYNTCDLPEKRFHADIRPHLWNWRQIADFRDKLLWYKGVHVDGATLHVDPDNRYSARFHYMTGRLGMMINKCDRPKVLDVLSLNGALVWQLLNACGGQLDRLYAYDQTSGIIRYMQELFKTMRADTTPVEYLLNADENGPKIPLENDQIDVMSCYERLEHFHDPLPLLKEMQRVLKPGGRALVVVSNRYYPHLYRYRRMRKKNYALGRNWNRGPEKKYEPREIENYFQSAGFRIISVEGFQPLEMKLTSLLAQLLRKVRCYRMADQMADRSSRLSVSRTRSKYFSGCLSYELTKD
ncbi:MAG: methyltransferase domain-containing protein, partial [Kiritimatiellales bacterium]|nr:methyltransferase domain-containing protein [Kiritimatiellales bacterium]